MVDAIVVLIVFAFGYLLRELIQRGRDRRYVMPELKMKEPFIFTKGVHQTQMVITHWECDFYGQESLQAVNTSRYLQNRKNPTG